MILVHSNSGRRVLVGEVVCEVYDRRLYATVAGWDPSTMWVHVWTSPEQIGDMRHHASWSAHYFGLEWREE